MLRTYANDIKGNMAGILAVIIMMLLTGVGAAVDLSKMHFQKTQYQRVADAAVLAAARSGEKTKPALRKIARKSVKANYGDIKDLKIDVVLSKNGYLQVHITGSHDTLIMGLFGQSNADIKVIAEAPLSVSDPANIALVLDTTGSMGGTKMANLKTAASDLVTMMEDYKNENLRMSVVPFAQYVNIGVSYYDKPWLEIPGVSPKPCNEADTSISCSSGLIWNGCVGSRTAPQNKRARYGSAKIPGLLSTGCGAEVLPLTDVLTDVDVKIKSLSAYGSTYIPSGLVWGWRTLSAKKPLTEANTKYKGNTRNIMILMTDGDNTISANGAVHDGSDTNAANKLTKALCKNVKADKIEIYTIAYEITDAATKKIMKNCATDADHYFDASSSAALKKAFRDIGESLLTLRITH